MSEQIKETYHVKSSNWDETIEVEFDLIVDLPMSDLHEMNSFWSNPDWRLKDAKGDIKQVICHLYAEALSIGYIHDECWDDKSANKYIEQREGFWHSPDVIIANFQGHFDAETKTTYTLVEQTNDK